MIEISNIDFKYAGSVNKVFEGFSLNLEENCIYGLLGKNGMGKSIVALSDQRTAPSTERQHHIRWYRHQAAPPGIVAGDVYRPKSMKCRRCRCASASR